MIKNVTFTDSFKNAVRGLMVIIKGERNIRIHISVALAVLWFARYFGLSSAEWCIVIVTVFLVPLCEGINTAIERAVDSSVKSYDPIAGAAKDAAAAVVLIVSAMSVAVGVILFLRPEVLSRIFIEYISSPVKLGGVLLYIVISILFIRRAYR